ncbi:MAG: LruC domain-containing protein [Bacteroidales bacterium]|nr:LruC domain-containing protein [Bacteroidales bacterium]
MKLQRIIIISLVSGLMLLACERNIPTGPGVANLRELDVPVDFSWTNAVESALTITLQNTSGLNTEGRIMQLMDENSRLIQISRVSDNKVVFRSEVPASITKMIAFFPMTRTRMEIDNIAGQRNVAMDLANHPGLESMNLKFSGSYSCDDGCDRSIEDKARYLEVKKDETVCLTGSLNGGLKISKGGTLKICGEANITWTDIKSKDEVTIIIGPTGSLTSKSFFLPGNKHYLYNFGTITLDNWLNIKGAVENYGTMTVKGLEIADKASFINTGTFTSTREVDIKGTLTNQEGGTFTIEENNNLNIQSKGRLENNCKFFVGKNVNLGDGYLVNNGYLRINGWFYGETKKDVLLGSSSMISVTNFQPDCKLVCKEGFASIKVDEKTNIDSKTTFEGSIDICDETGIDNIWTKAGELPENVSQCEVYIAAGSCNPEGIGTPAVKDSDGDGIIDDEDEYPDDPDRAFSSNEPYAGYKVWAFEDLWPSTADYDFNDLVIGTRIKYILNAQMLPVKAEIEIVMRGIGASINNGLGLQFLSDNLPDGNMIASLSGADASMDKTTGTCIRVTNNIFESLSSKYNNNGQGPSKEPDVWRFEVSFDQKVVNSTSLYSDFFLFRTDDRGHEIHVAGKPATAAADHSQFGLNDDNTNPEEGYWYKTLNGIPWGITLITIDQVWDHPSEKNSILEAYPDFQIWATSGGSANTKWYTNEVYKLCFHR